MKKWRKNAEKKALKWYEEIQNKPENQIFQMMKEKINGFSNFLEFVEMEICLLGLYYCKKISESLFSALCVYNQQCSMGFKNMPVEEYYAWLVLFRDGKIGITEEIYTVKPTKK